MNGVHALRKVSDMETTDEGLSFMTENTYLDGQRLKDLYEDAELFFESVQQDAETLEERFQMEDLSERLSYNFDPQVMNLWLKDPSISMKKLIDEREDQILTETEAAVTDSADHAKEKLDDIVSEVRTELPNITDPEL